MKSLPEDVAVYSRTPEYSQENVPDSFLGRSHSTKAGVWARIRVIEGSVRYRILEPQLEEVVLTPDHPGVVEPKIVHEVEPIGDARFYIEFLRAGSK
jgi:tellurite resistance-related uncharacterized protein